MGLQALVMTLTIPLLVAIYTWNYARWAGKQQLYRGAVGLYLLAAATLVVPFLVMWRTS